MNTITINGKTIKTNGSISIINNRVVLDGKPISDETDNIEVIINGDCGNIRDVAGNITVQGNCENIEDVVGNIKIDGSVIGSISDVTGNIMRK